MVLGFFFSCQQSSVRDCHLQIFHIPFVKYEKLNCPVIYSYEHILNKVYYVKFFIF